MAKTPFKLAMMAVAVLLVTTFFSYAFIPSAQWETQALLGFWLSAAITAVFAYLPRGIHGVWVLLASVNAGLWLGIVAHSAGGGVGIALALPFTFLFFPAAWLQKREIGVAVKIAASWILAVSILAGMVSISPVPGYEPDHME